VTTTSARRLISGSATIAASPSAVYDVLIDLDRWSELDPTLLELVPRDRLVPGSHGTMTNRRAAVMRVTTAWDIVELAPGERYVVRIVGRGYELIETVDLSPTDGGTTVSVADDLRATSLAGRVMVPMSGGIIRRDLEGRLARLRAVLERRADPQTIGQ
jgi:hypothetical protein